MKQRGRGRKSRFQTDTAKERIDSLYSMAFDMVRSGDLPLARRYTTLARKIGMRYTVRIPTTYRRRTCRGCMVPLIASRTARIRFGSGRETVTCLECGHISRYPYKGGKRFQEE